MSSSRCGRACRTYGTCSQPLCRKGGARSRGSARSWTADCESLSGCEHGRAGRLAALEIPMGLCRVLQRVFLVDRNLDLAAPDHVEQLLGRREQILALGRVGVERGPRDVERALLREDAEIERLDRARCIAEAHEQAERA